MGVRYVDSIWNVNKNGAEGTQNVESCDAKSNTYLNTCRYKISDKTLILIVEVSNKHHCKLDKILDSKLETFIATIIAIFSCFRVLRKVYVSFQYLDTNKGSILFSHYCTC